MASERMGIGSGIGTCADCGERIPPPEFAHRCKPAPAPQPDAASDDCTCGHGDNCHPDGGPCLAGGRCRCPAYCPVYTPPAPEAPDRPGDGGEGEVLWEERVNGWPMRLDTEGRLWTQNCIGEWRPFTVREGGIEDGLQRAARHLARALAAERERREMAEAKAAVIGGEFCRESRERGCNPCGACVLCVADERERREAAEAEVERLREMVEGAYREGWSKAVTKQPPNPALRYEDYPILWRSGDEDWERSNARAALRGEGGHEG